MNPVECCMQLQGLSKLLVVSKCLKTVFFVCLFLHVLNIENVLSLYTLSELGSITESITSNYFCC